MYFCILYVILKKKGDVKMKTTKILSLLLAVVILISTVFSVTAFATADDGTYKNFKYTVTDENSAVISKYTGNESSVIIPESINGYPVTEIGNSAFKGNFSTLSGIVMLSSPVQSLNA